VRFDERGWPVVEAAPAAETRSAAAPPPPARAIEMPLPAVFRAVGAPPAFSALGRVTARWRVTVHGPGGEPLGVRTILHAADLAQPRRDRLEYEDGRVYRRADGLVAAEQHGMPWPTLLEVAREELELFGLHLRLPWAFADERTFAVGAAEPGGLAGGQGEQVVRLAVQRRSELARNGPWPEPVDVDRFVLLCPAGGGPPLGLEQHLAGPGTDRQVRLEDWRPVRQGDGGQGVGGQGDGGQGDGGALRLPFRRVYADATGRPATTLELVELQFGDASR
jgi:hypothetical protein